MMRLAVIAGQLFAGANLSEGVEFQPPVSHAHVAVGLAGMVHVLEMISAARSVYGCAVAQFHYLYRVMPARASSGFRLRDDFPAQLSDLAPGREPREREKSTAMNAARPDLEFIVLHVG